MSNFKVGEKVVWISESVPNPLSNPPKKGDIVTLKSPCTEFEDNWDILGYEYNNYGCLQSFHSRHFRKLDHQFSEDVIAEIIKQVQEESLTLSN